MALSAAAQVIGDRPVLHVDLPPPDEGNQITIGDQPKPFFGPEPGAGQNPSAFAWGSKILPAPQSGPEPSDSEPVHGGKGLAVDRMTESRPDTLTNADDTLQYVTVFNPAVLPFKRMSALDSVRADYTMYVADEDTLQDLPVGGAPSPDRDLFWGDLAVQLRPGRDVPIPSVAPNMRVLSYETEPRITVSFSKDGADNYYVRSDESGVEGTYRLRFMADAPAIYFAPQVPSNLRVDDVARRAPPGLLKELPPSIQGSVNRALERLSIDRSMPLRRALNNLTRHFRDFQAGHLVQDTSDLYLDLVYQQMGVCRHRAFAFMVTASGLGIPTRYVTNEAHAWVEVWLPEVEWLRIDLGGAALRMVVDNAEDKSVYQPRGADPFAQPPDYQNNYTRLEGDITGLTDEQIAEGRQTASVLEPTATAALPPTPQDDPRNLVIGPGTSLPTLPAEVMEDKRPTRLSIGYVDPEGFRGESITVSGKLVSGDKGVGGQRIDIHLAPAGSRGNQARLLDRTVTSSDGSFTIYVQLPPDLELQGYEVYASTPGDRRFAPALSD